MKHGARLAGLLVAGLLPLGCGDSTGPETASRQLRLSVYAGMDAAVPAAVLQSGAGITLSAWTETGTLGSPLTQGLYADSRRGIRSRILYEDGLPSQVYDERTGEVVVIQRAGKRVEFLAYDRNQQYVGGAVVSWDGSDLQLAELQWRPSLTGQITAVSDAVSFAVTAEKSAGLGAPIEAPPTLAAFFQEGLRTPQSAADFEGTLVLAGLTLLGAQQQAAASRLSDASANAGALIIPAWPIALGAAVVFTYVFQHETFLPSIMKEAENQLDLFAEKKISEDRSPWEIAKAAYESIKSTGQALIDEAAEVVTRSGDAAKDAIERLRPTGHPTVTGGPEEGLTSLEGYGVDQSGTVYPLTGSVNRGSVSVLGVKNGRTLSINGTTSGTSFNGQYSGSPGSGTLSGRTQALSQCQTNQASGGQGTFARIFDLGAPTGTIQFRYQAYNIPDAFDVITNGQTVVSTGMVSGSSSRTVTLNGSSIVAVTVSAPKSGTAWEFSLTCPS